MIIQILSENKGNLGLEGEFGLCVLVEVNGLRFLVDTGASCLFAQNAQKLGINLVPNFCVCSHNHWDHNGGLEYFLDNFPNAECYMSRQIDCTYGVRDNKKKKYGKSSDFYKKYFSRITYVSDSMQIAEGVYLFKAPYVSSECRNSNLYIKKHGFFVRDRFEHELNVAIIENNCLSVISPCSHKGAVNILNTALKLFPNAKRGIFLGGLHTKGSALTELNCTVDVVDGIAEGLKKADFCRYYLAHCTGERAFSIIKDKLKDKAETFCTGDKIEFISD